MSSLPRYTVTVNGKTVEATLCRLGAESVDFEVNGKAYQVSLGISFLPSGLSPAQLSGPAASIPPQLQVVPPKTSPSSALGDGNVRAPMPGIVVSVLVKENDTITAGQTVAVIEAMKMENNIASPVSGIVGSIGVQPGKEVELGQILISLAQNSATKKSEDAGAIKIKGAA